jgi:ribosome-associated toxin RatA of RatAB toxin-antitoxin module
MKHVKKSVLLWYSANEMYRLVTAVADYPRFLPWCERAEVLESRADGMTARLHLNYHGVRHAFTTRNLHAPDESVRVELVDGPFSKLEGSWQFVHLGSPAATDDAALLAGATAPSACKIEFDLAYAFSGSALEAVISPVFGRIAHSLVDAFVQRAEQVYGAR